MLLRNPGFSAVIIFTLALGIAANTAIFTVVNAILLRSLPYEGVERVVWIWGKWPGGDQASISAPDLDDYRAQSQSFEHLGAFANALIPFNLTQGSEPERVDGYYITANFFQALGVKPSLGRTFRQEEEQAGRDRVVILSHSLWQRNFGGDPAIIDSTIKINSEDFIVVGVMPPSVDMPKSAELWTPVPFYLAEMKMRRAHSLRPIGRLKPGITLEQAQAELDIIGAQLEQQYPDSNSGWGVKLAPLREQIFGDLRLALLVLLGATAFVLLIACANVANLLLARATVRKKEMALRTALGATRDCLIRQLFTESILLALIGGIIGTVLAFWGVKALVQMAPASIPRINEVDLDGKVLGVMLLVSAVTGIIFGLAPAIQATRPDLSEALKEGGRNRGESSRNRLLRNLLVGAEVALALVLLVGSGLMIKSFLRLQEVNPGFNPENVLTMRIALPTSRYDDAMKRADFFHQAMERIENLPGVEAVGAISDLPLSGESSDTYFTVEGRALADPNQKPVANFRAIGRNYFHAMRIPLLKGRYFTEQEAMGAPMVIINNSLAKRYFPDEEPLGKHLIIDVGEPLQAEIVGVVGDVRHYLLELEPFDEMYLPFNIFPETNLVVRAKTDPLTLIGRVRSEIRSLDKDQPVSQVRSMEQVVASSIAEPRFRTLLLTIFAGMALVLAIVGVYGVMSYSSSQRTHEIGIRIALGAQRGQIIKLVMGQGLILTLCGLGAGVAASFALTRFISSMLFEVRTVDAMTYLGAALLLVIVALTACYIPARRATKVDPMTTLRNE